MIPQNGYWRRLNIGVGVNDPLSVRAHRYGMICIFRREQGHSLAIQTRSVQRLVIRVLVRVHTYCREQKGTGRFINPKHIHHIPVPFRDPVFQLTRCQIVEIEVPPVVTAIKPQKLTAFVKDSPIGNATGREIGLKKEIIPIFINLIHSPC